MSTVTQIVLNATAEAALNDHERPCTAEEIRETNCLNGGKCFALPGPHGPQTQCFCPYDFVGRKCEEYFIDIDIWGFGKSHPECISKVSLGILGAICGFLLIMVLLMVIYIMRERRRKLTPEEVGSNPTRQPLVQQFSYSNVHGVRVLHSQGSVEVPPSHCVVAINHENPGFVTFSKPGQEAMSDYGGSHDQIDTTQPLNNNDVSYHRNGDSTTVTSPAKKINSKTDTGASTT